MDGLPVPTAAALRRDLPATAGYFGVDLADAGQLADLTAVAIAQLAWRNGPVELWHRASPSRISDPEMMRANAATTRVVRAHLPDDVIAGLAASTDAILGTVCDVLTDPGRRLPDGRTVLDVAATAEDFELYTEQVRTFFDRCYRLVDQRGHGCVLARGAAHLAARPGMAAALVDLDDRLMRPGPVPYSIKRRARRPAQHRSQSEGFSRGTPSTDQQISI